MNCALTDWQDVFLMIGVAAVFVVPVLGWYIHELQQKVARLDKALRRLP